MSRFEEREQIIKGFNFESDSGWTGEGTGIAAMILNLWDKTIDVSLISGKTPMVQDVILFLLSDKDVRRMIQDYQGSKKRRKYLFAINRTVGFSGREDYYINLYDEYGIQFRGKKLLHVSQEEKLNEGWRKMWIGDFVELIAFMTDNTPATATRKELRKRSGCRYIKLYTKDPDTLTKEVSKII